MDRLQKAASIKSTVLSESTLYKDKEVVPTSVPMINVALSGKLDGGLTSGLTVLAGPSKHFKTAFGVLLMGAFLNKYEEAVCLFYDSEFGTPENYFSSFGVDTNRVLHTPVMDIEELKFDIMKKMKEIGKKDKVFIFVDSIGNLASKKEVEDALNEKSVADMTRAKQIKSLFRMVTPYLTTHDIPMVAVNHTYQTQEMFSKAVVSGGCVIEGTKLQTKDGLKEIQDFNVGEKVITLDGEKKVTHIWNPDTLEEGNPECYEIEFEDGYKVTCSDKHKFLIDGGWVEAKDLIVGSDVTNMGNLNRWHNENCKHKME